MVFLFQPHVSNLRQVSIAVLLVSDGSETQPIHLSRLNLTHQKKHTWSVSLVYSLQVCLEEVFQLSPQRLWTAPVSCSYHWREN